MSKKPTYVYEKPQRNFVIGNDIPAQLSKVEKWRLGFETSEDALSWNVFIGLFVLEGLKEVFEQELYLWGNRIDTECRKWEKLLEIQRKLESDIAIPTEPDIMLRVPGQAIVLIEAKFGSSNPRLAGKKRRFGGVPEFVNRYECRVGAVHPLNREWILEQEDNAILEQLYRNAVFAHWLASDPEQQFVVNLVARTATSDERLFRQHLSENGVQFHVRRWEDLYVLPVMRGENASVLRRYLENKTINLKAAFDLK
jgi:hypothetical protein